MELHRHEAALPARTGIDPVCGMTVDRDHPRGGKLVSDGREIGFCSAKCKAKFEAEPAKYLGPKKAESQPPPGARTLQFTRTLQFARTLQFIRTLQFARTPRCTRPQHEPGRRQIAGSPQVTHPPQRDSRPDPCPPGQSSPAARSPGHLYPVSRPSRQTIPRPFRGPLSAAPSATCPMKTNRL